MTGEDNEEQQHNCELMRREGETRLVDLSADIISLIFLKLGPVEILRSAQYVCSWWRNLSKQSHLYRSLDFRNQWKLYEHEMNEKEKQEKRKIVRLALHRSCGQLVEFSIDGFLDRNLLHFILSNISSAKHLNCLRFVAFRGEWENELLDAFKNALFLEELDLSYCNGVSRRVIQEIGRSCLRLKSFQFDYYCVVDWSGDEQAIAIAENMPTLRRLCLLGNSLTKLGLQAILRGCPYLEDLDLRCCRNLDLTGEEELKGQCEERIRNVRFANDSTRDYQYHDIQWRPSRYDNDYDDNDYDDDSVFRTPKAMLEGRPKTFGGPRQVQFCLQYI